MIKMTAQKWKKILLWLSAYASVVAFALVGGYFMLKDDDEEVKKTAKNVLLIYILFTVISAFFAVVSYFGGMFDGWYGSVIYKIYGIANTLVSIARIATYATFALLVVFKDNNVSEAPALDAAITEETVTEHPDAESTVDTADEENN